MPEAPEVHTVLRYLKEELQDVSIAGVQILHSKLCANMEPAVFEATLAGQHFRRFHRHGKYLVLELDSQDLVSHLRMEGKYQIFACQQDVDALDEKERKHIHALFSLGDGRVLAYRDTRKFGRMYLYARQENWRELPVLSHVGKDALDESLSPQELLHKALRRKIPVKSFLLDQSVIAGIGNIYADEILFDSRISPFTPACTLTREDCRALLNSTRSILLAAVEQGGTTIRSFSYDGAHAGSYQNQLKVHGKAENCPLCQTPLVCARIGGRSTWYCPHCQPEREKAPVSKPEKEPVLAAEGMETKVSEEDR